MKDGEIINPFGMASLKTEGEKIGYIDARATGNETASKSRWIEVCYDPDDFAKTGIKDSVIESIYGEFYCLFSNLDEETRYILATALINKLIPESGY